MSVLDRIIHYADPRTVYAAHQQVVRQAERFANTVQRAHSAEGIKRTTREIAAVYVEAEPYVVGALTFVASAFFSPIVGAALGTAATAASYETGALAARNEGKHGEEARDAGREHRKLVGEAAIVGTTAGILTGVAVGALAAAPVAAGDVPALAAAEGGSGVALNSASVAGVSAAAEAAAPAVVTVAGDALPALVAQAPAAALDTGLFATAEEAAAAATGFTPLPAGGVPALQAAQAAATSSGGFWSTVGDLGKLIIPTALQKLLTPTPSAPKSGVDLGAQGAGAGAAGAGDSALGEDGAYGSLPKIPTFVKVIGAVAVTLIGLHAGKKLKRKAG